MISYSDNDFSRMKNIDKTALREKYGYLNYNNVRDHALKRLGLKNYKEFYEFLSDPAIPEEIKMYKRVNELPKAKVVIPLEHGSPEYFAAINKYIAKLEFDDKERILNEERYERERLEAIEKQQRENDALNRPPYGQPQPQPNLEVEKLEAEEMLIAAEEMLDEIAAETNMKNLSLSDIEDFDIHSCESTDSPVVDLPNHTAINVMHQLSDLEPSDWEILSSEIKKLKLSKQK